MCASMTGSEEALSVAGGIKKKQGEPQTGTPTSNSIIA